MNRWFVGRWGGVSASPHPRTIFLLPTSCFPSPKGGGGGEGSVRIDCNENFLHYQIKL
jgi:hypothetical protein